MKPDTAPAGKRDISKVLARARRTPNGPISQYLAQCGRRQMAFEVQVYLEREAIMKGSIRAGFVAALILTMCAAGAFAQSAVSNSSDVNLNNAVTVNNCSTGEPVALNGDVQVSYSVTTDGAGNNNFSISAANNLSGSGQKSGASYLASDSDT